MHRSITTYPHRFPFAEHTHCVASYRSISFQFSRPVYCNSSTSTRGQAHKHSYSQTHTTNPLSSSLNHQPRTEKANAPTLLPSSLTPRHRHHHILYTSSRTLSSSFSLQYLFKPPPNKCPAVIIRLSANQLPSGIRRTRSCSLLHYINAQDPNVYTPFLPSSHPIIHPGTHLSTWSHSIPLLPRQQITYHAIPTPQRRATSPTPLPPSAISPHDT